MLRFGIKILATCTALVKSSMLEKFSTGVRMHIAGNYSSDKL